ncbi:MAG: hypothetical protein Q9184_000286 [Pyrenodesmia sp. 2 TL-2023]
MDVNGVDIKEMDPADTIAAEDAASSPATLHLAPLSDSNDSLNSCDKEPEPVTASAGENILSISQIHETKTEVDGDGDQPNNEGAPVLPSTTAPGHRSPIAEAKTSCEQACHKRQDLDSSDSPPSSPPRKRTREDNRMSFRDKLRQIRRECGGYREIRKTQLIPDAEQGRSKGGAFAARESATSGSQRDGS